MSFTLFGKRYRAAQRKAESYGKPGNNPCKGCAFDVDVDNRLVLECPTLPCGQTLADLGKRIIWIEVKPKDKTK